MKASNNFSGENILTNVFVKKNSNWFPISNFAALIAQASKTPGPGDLFLSSESKASKSSFSVTILKQNFSFLDF